VTGDLSNFVGPENSFYDDEKKLSIRGVKPPGQGGGFTSSPPSASLRLFLARRLTPVLMLARLLCLLACLSVAAGFVATPLVSASQLQQSRVATQQIVMAAPTKPMKVNERNRIANKAHKSEMRTRVKRVSAASRASAASGVTECLARISSANAADFPPLPLAGAGIPRGGRLCQLKLAALQGVCYP
jgi:ribosomal protein S20